MEKELLAGITATLMIHILKLIEKIEQLSDPRQQWGNIRHKLVDLVCIGLVSVICGGTDFEHMEDTGYGKLNF